MTMAEFHNGLRILRSIDSWELGDPEWWPRFRDDPYRFFMRADNDTCMMIWSVVMKRSTKQ